MTINLDGIGNDWVVTRKPGGKPELHTYTSLAELQRVLRRALLKAGPSAPVAPVVALPLNGTAPSPLKIEQDPDPVFDCQACGACCVAEDRLSKTHVRLEREDKLRLGNRLPILRKSEGDFLRTKKIGAEVVCAALDGRPGDKCSCSIYAERPLVCQLFEVGGEECLQARARQTEGVSSAS